jgi:hypothetical protein
MLKAMVRMGLLAGLALAGVRCGQDADSPLSVEEGSSERLGGHWSSDAGAFEFESTRSGPLAGDVSIAVGALTYDVRYDFAAREVVADGHDGALDRPTQRLLRIASDDIARSLAAASVATGPRTPGGPTAERGSLLEPMLYASLVLLADSGGMPLSRQVFRLAPPEVDKSLDNDGVTCIERGDIYAVSFDSTSGTTLDLPVMAGAEDCNGRCGPGCTALTPWAMWTLDCLEHDTCCDATGDPACWTPLGECGDEYVHAETDFLRGFDPLSRHCGGS